MIYLLLNMRTTSIQWISFLWNDQKKYRNEKLWVFVIKTYEVLWLWINEDSDGNYIQKHWRKIIFWMQKLFKIAIELFRTLWIEYLVIDLIHSSINSRFRGIQFVNLMPSVKWNWVFWFKIQLNWHRVDRIQFNSVIANWIQKLKSIGFLNISNVFILEHYPSNHFVK